VISALSTGSAEFLVPVVRPGNFMVVLPLPSDWRQAEDSWIHGYRRGYFRLPLLVGPERAFGPAETFKIGTDDWKRQLCRWAQANEEAAGDVARAAGLFRSLAEFHTDVRPTEGRHPLVDRLAEMLDFTYFHLCGKRIPISVVTGRMNLRDAARDQAAAVLDALADLPSCRLWNRGRVHVLSPSGYWEVRRVIRDPDGRYTIRFSPKAGAPDLRVDVDDEERVRDLALVLSGSARVLEVIVFGPIGHVPWHSMYVEKPPRPPLVGLDAPCVGHMSAFWPRRITSRAELMSTWQPGAYLWHYDVPGIDRYLAKVLNALRVGLQPIDRDCLDLVAQVAYGRRRIGPAAVWRRGVGAFRELAAAAEKLDLIHRWKEIGIPVLRELMEICEKYVQSSNRASADEVVPRRRARVDLLAEGARRVLEMWRFIDNHGQATVWHLLLTCEAGAPLFNADVKPKVGYLHYRCI